MKSRVRISICVGTQVALVLLASALIELRHEFLSGYKIEWYIIEAIVVVSAGVFVVSLLQSLLAELFLASRMCAEGLGWFAMYLISGLVMYALAGGISSIWTRGHDGWLVWRGGLMAGGMQSILSGGILLLYSCRLRKKGTAKPKGARLNFSDPFDTPK